MIRQYGDPVLNFQVPQWPKDLVLQGRFARLESLKEKEHGAGLYQANAEDTDGLIWDYLPYGPFETEKTYRAWVSSATAQADPAFLAIRDLEQDRLCGVASFLRIKPEAGSIEVGHINFSPALQKTPAATEAMYLMMKWAFEAGYRRYEWKCDALNIGSRRAAQRLGLSYEGVFRQATIYKDRNRDTAWFAAIDKEWPALKQAFETWLAPDNFVNGRQVQRLSDLMRSVLVASDPQLGR